MIPIIGIAGRARSGKDTVAGIIQAARPGQFYRYAFAEPLKEMLWAGLRVDCFANFDMVKEDPIPELGGITRRRLMQTIGTEWGRNTVTKDIWVLQAQRVVDEHPPGEAMLITDVRFENEASWIRSSGGVIVHLRRNGVAPVSAHASESGIAVAGGDIVIDNDGTIDDLSATVRRLVFLELL